MNCASEIFRFLSRSWGSFPDGRSLDWAAMARGEVPWKVVAVGWALLNAGLITMLGVLLLFVFASPLPPITTVKVAPATTNPSYVLEASFPGPDVVGLVRFDNSTEAHALTPTVGPLTPQGMRQLGPSGATGPSGPSGPSGPTGPTGPSLPGVSFTFVWGLMRFDNFSFQPAPGQSMYLCSRADLPAATVVEHVMMAQPGLGVFCVGLPGARVGQAASNRTQLTSKGSFDVPLNVAYALLDMAELVLIAQPNPNDANSSRVVSRALLCVCNLTALLSNSSSQQSFGEVVGQYADYSRFVLAVAILLALECALTLCLTWERRHHQFLTILICVLIMLQDSMIILYSSRDVINKDTDINALCLALGPVFHLFVTSSLAWYAAATFNVLVIFFRNGQFGRFAYAKSSYNAVWYHVVCWSFVLVDFCIVWGLYGITTPDGRHMFSYGPVPPYAFCWILDSRVLIGAFFAPALAVLTFSLVATVVVCFQVCSVRCYHKKVNAQTILEVMSIFLTCSGGLIALVVLGTLLVIYADDPQPFLLLIAALLFLLQSVALWLVVFPRQQAMMLWAYLLTCTAGQLQRKGSSLKSMNSSNMFQRTISTPLSSPAASPPVSQSSGQLDL
jgi:hypothetical protein